MPAGTKLRSLFVFVSFTLFLIAPASPQVNVTTYHNDTARTGQNTAEAGLTLQNVNVYNFGRIFTINLNGQVYAQPLVLANVSIGGGTHTVVYVATENDVVYAMDANNGTFYWQRTLLYNGGKPIPTGDFGFNNNISPNYGITGTPVIDPSSNTMYLVASSEESGPIAVHRFHALDVRTGVDKFGSPVVVGGSFSGLEFNPALEFNRPGLLLVDGHVIVAFGKHTDTADYGWVFSYSASTLAEEAAFGTDPVSGSRPYGGIWMGGDGVAADPNGYLFFSTANGDFDEGPDYGNSIVKLGLPLKNAFPFLDYFTPHDQERLNDYDYDLGSGGVLVLPNLTSGSHPQLLVQSGKEGTIYLVDRTKMGGYCGSATCTNAVVQELTGALVGGNSLNLDGVWGSPAYWNGYVYFGSANKDVANVADYMKAYSFNASGSGVLSSTPTSHTSETFAWPAPSPSTSSNGKTNGILWAIDSNNSVLHAYNAANLATELYNSNMDPSRDQFGGALKFTVPTVANGLVFVGGNGALSVFGPTGTPCLATTSCSVGGQPPYQTVAGGVTVQCGQALMLTASATICGNTCVTNNVAPPVPTTNVGAGDGTPGAGGSCSLSWTWPGGGGSQVLNVP